MCSLIGYSGGGSGLVSADLDIQLVSVQALSRKLPSGPALGSCLLERRYDGMDHANKIKCAFRIGDFKGAN